MHVRTHLWLPALCLASALPLAVASQHHPRALSDAESVATFGDQSGCTNNCVKNYACNVQFVYLGTCAYCDDAELNFDKCCALGKAGQACNSASGTQCSGAPYKHTGMYNTQNQSCNGCQGTGMFTGDGNCGSDGPYVNTPTGDACAC